MKKLSVVLFVGAMVLGVVRLSYAEWADYVVISEIQADSTDSKDDEWVELYNPTDSPKSLSGHRIERYTATGTRYYYRFDTPSEIEIKTTTTIPSHGFYLIVENNASASLIDMADALFLTTFELDTDDVICFGTGKMDNPDDLDTIDWVGFGDSTYDSEGNHPAPNPPEGKSIERRGYGGSEPTTYPNSGNGWDTDDNSADFVTQSSANPQNSSDTHEPYVSDTVSEEGVDYTFAFGDATVAVINFTALTGPGTVTVSPYPNCYPPNYPNGRPVKRYVSITHSGISNYTASLKLYYDPTTEKLGVSDISGNPTHLGRYTDTSWEYHAASGIGENWVQTDGVTVFSPWGIGGQDASLPIDLSSFTAIRIDSGVMLQWTTETEIDHVGWEIYRSEKKDGKFVKINDELIKGSGNSGMPRYYQYVDKTAIAGRQYYYYLEDIDIFGNVGKSDIIGISKGKAPSAKGTLSTTWGAIKQKRRW